MRLERLYVQGFKSFKDRTAINFDEGITGIVGPNGCGKSNIVDALFWVMGEQSAKHLRGKSMQDLIFSGTDRYSPSSFAEVTLVLKNEGQKHIHINNKVFQPSEIQLTRKLYRNGETEYRINDQICRLKDIQEVFMDTGAGAKSYSIIAQGEINRLVQAKPVERRTMIEEVAGITKFKMRRRESLKKIENTQQNLARLQDIQSEIHKNLKSLEIQAEKANRARSLREKLIRHDLIVESNNEYELLTGLRESYQKITNNRAELEKLSAERTQIENSLTQERNLKLELTEKIDIIQAEYNQFSKQLAAAEEKLSYLHKSKSEKEDYAESLSSEVLEMEQLKEQRAQRLLQIEEELKELENNNPLACDLEGMKNQYLALKGQVDSHNSILGEKERYLDQLRGEKDLLEKEIFKNQSLTDDCSQTLQTLFEEIEATEKNAGIFFREIKEKTEIIDNLSKELGELDDQIVRSKTQIEDLQIQTKDLDLKQRSLTQTIITFEAKIASLQEINNALEGKKKGALQFLESTPDSGELFGRIIQSDQEYAPAVETLLGHLFDSLINTNENWSEACQWHQKNTDQALSWVFTNEKADISESSQRLEVCGLKNVTPVASLVEIKDTQFTGLATMLSGYYVVDQLDWSLIQNLPKDIQYHAISSKDGRCLLRKEGGILQFELKSDQELNDGFVQRNNKINQLQQDLLSAKDELTVVLASYESKSGELSSIQGQYNQSRELRNEKHAKLSSYQASMDSQKRIADKETDRLTGLISRKSELSKKKLDYIEQAERYHIDIKNMNDQFERALAEVHEVRTSLESLNASYQRARDEFSTTEANSRNYQSQLKNFNSQMADLKNQITQTEHRILSHGEKINALNDEIESINNEVQQLITSNRILKEDLLKIEDQLKDSKESLNQLALKMSDREKNSREVAVQVSKLDKEIGTTEVRIEKHLEDEELVVRNSFEKYQIDLRAILSSFIELEESVLDKLHDVSSIFFQETEDGVKEIQKNYYEFKKKFPGEIRDSKDRRRQYKTDLSRLGDINWQAIEDYDAQKIRYDFLKKQEEELKISLADLHQAIDHIDQKSKIRFSEAFHEVNERFTKVFPIIFGGGSARLEISGSLDDQECGIEIIAQPPGKKMQNINLMSGGEKAMTAVSLIFSIFLVKPSPFCLLDEVDAPLDDANVGRFNELLREMSSESQFILITHNKKTMELNDSLYGITMEEPGVSKAISVKLQ